MFTATDKNSPSQLIRMLGVLGRRTAGRDELLEFRTEVLAARSQVKVALERWEDAVEQRIAGTAELTYRDWVVDQIVARLARKINAEVDGDRDDPRFVRLLGKGHRDATRGSATDEQEQYVNTLLSGLDQDKSMAHLAPDGAELKAANSALKHAKEQRKLCYTDEEIARRQLVETKKAAIGVFNAAFHTLSLIYRDQDVLVRSFFYRKEIAGDESEPTGEE